ncbi:MAG: hypothetical protein R2754_04395 [Microthrixaceae bacterium]
MTIPQSEDTRPLHVAPLEPAERRALMEAEVGALMRSSALALMLPVAVLALLVALVATWWLGLLVLVLGTAAALGAVAWRRSRSVDAVLEALGARPLRPGEHPGYDNLIDGLCMASGQVEPGLFVVDDPAANAATVAAPGTHCVVVTSGLLEAADRIRLEAVLAQQVAHLLGGDAEAATAAHAFRTSIGWRHGLDRVLPNRREELADLNALDITRYPPGLIDALELVGALGPGVTVSAPEVAHLWFVAPDPAQVANAAQVSLNRRLALLREL